VVSSALPFLWCTITTMLLRFAARSAAAGCSSRRGLLGVVAARPTWQEPRQPVSVHGCVQLTALRMFGSRKRDAEDPRTAFEALALLQRELGLNSEDADDDFDPDEERIVHVGIIGEPNVGKSSLLNLLVDSPVSAVSPKRNTTRESIAGVHIENNTQIVFHDTPGFMKKEVRRVRVRCAGRADACFFCRAVGWRVIGWRWLRVRFGLRVRVLRVRRVGDAVARCGCANSSIDRRVLCFWQVHREFFQPLQRSVVDLCREVDVILLVIDAARRLDLKQFNVVEGVCVSVRARAFVRRRACHNETHCLAHAVFFRRFQCVCPACTCCPTRLALIIPVCARVFWWHSPTCPDLGTVLATLPEPPQVVLVLNKVDLVEPKARIACFYFL
jgi:hypothetical protein